MPKDWETNESIFVCDPPPGTKWILSCKRELTRDQMDEIREQWEQILQNSKAQIIILGPEFSIEVITPNNDGWPDAKFCAA